MASRCFLDRNPAIASAATIASASIALAGGHLKDIVDTAVGAGSAVIWVVAVQAANLVGTLKREGLFTVFRSIK